MSLAVYRSVLRAPGVARLLLLGVVARIPSTAAGIVLLLHVESTLGRSWLAAGLVGAATTVGAAVGAPWRGRVVDRLGLRRALVPSIIVEALVWGLVPVLPYQGLLVAAVVGGLFGLPIFTVVRQSLSVLVPERRRRTAYAVDSIGVELSFMVGPAAGVLVVTQMSSTAAVLAVGVSTVLAGLALAAVNPPTRSEQVAGRRVGLDVDRSDVVTQVAPVAPGAVGRAVLGATDETEAGARGGPRRPLGPTASGGLLAVLGAALGATVVLAGTDVGIVAALREAQAIGMTWLVFGAWGVASITGALVYGAVTRPIHPMGLLLALALLTVPVGLATTPWALALAILPAGALCAPVISSTAEAVARLVPEASRGEAMGWHGSALTVGGAVGAPAAGAAIDAFGPAGAFALVGTIGGVAAVAGLTVLQLRRRDLTAAPVVGLAQR